MMVDQFDIVRPDAMLLYFVDTEEIQYLSLEVGAIFLRHHWFKVGSMSWRGHVNLPRHVHVHVLTKLS